MKRGEVGKNDDRKICLFMWMAGIAKMVTGNQSYVMKRGADFFTKGG